MGGWRNWVMGNKEGPGGNGHWVFYVTDESLNSTSATNHTLSVN